MASKAKFIIAGLLLVAGCSQGKPNEGAENEQVASADTATAPGGFDNNMPVVEQGAQGTSPAEPKDAPAAAAATAAPSETPAPVQAPIGTGQFATYTVQKEDTLMKIAFNLYGDITRWRTLFEMNKDKISDTNALVVGAELKYEKPATEPNIQKNGEPYLIKKGDTLGRIAWDIYGLPSKWKTLWENNKTLVRDPNKIYAGFYVYYQITEEEKQQAEKLKMEHPMTHQLGAQPSNGSGMPTDSAPPPQEQSMNAAPAPMPAANPVMPAQPDPMPAAAAPTPQQQAPAMAPPAPAVNPDSGSGSGLNGFLQRIIPNRAPAAQK